MSVEYYLACEKCKKIYHVAQDGFSGFTFYSGEPKCMKGIGKFLEEHTLCGTVKLLPDREADDYDEVNWPTAPTV